MSPAAAAQFRFSFPERKSRLSTVVLRFFAIHASQKQQFIHSTFQIANQNLVRYHYN
jgi:hypothetical protein